MTVSSNTVVSHRTFIFLVPKQARERKKNSQNPERPYDSYSSNFLRRLPTHSIYVFPLLAFGRDGRRSFPHFIISQSFPVLWI